jgi:hypothetical protein
MCLPTSLKTYRPKQVALSQNGAFPDYYRWEWYHIVSDSLRNSRAGSRTIYQHGVDVNVLFERRVAVVNTQSQHRSRKNGGLTQLLALEQTVAAQVLCSRKISIGR